LDLELSGGYFRNFRKGDIDGVDIICLIQTGSSLVFKKGTAPPSDIINQVNPVSKAKDSLDE